VTGEVPQGHWREPGRREGRRGETAPTSASRETCQRANVTADGGFRNRLGTEATVPAGAP